MIATRNQRLGLSIPSRSLTRVRYDRDNIFGILIDRSKVKSKRQIKKKQVNKVIEIDMMRIDPGAIGFTSGFSQEHKYSTVGEHITVQQLTELSIVMSISRQ